MIRAEDLGGPWTERGSVPVASGSIAYCATGEGEAVVFLHKLGGWAADWRHVAARFPAGYRLVALDLTGHGDSENEPPDDWYYPLELLAQDIEEAISGLGLDRVSFVCNSLGGCAAIVVAAQSPDRVSKLVLMSVAMGEGRPRAEAEALDTREDSFYDSDGNPIPRSFEHIRRTQGVTDPSVVDEQNASRAKAGRWIRWTQRGVALAPITSLLPKVTAPTLLLHGERDSLIQSFETRALSLLPHGSAIHLPNAGRFPQQEQPEATAQAIIEFLA